MENKIDSCRLQDSFPAICPVVEYHLAEYGAVMNGRKESSVSAYTVYCSCIFIVESSPNGLWQMLFSGSKDFYLELISCYPWVLGKMSAFDVPAVEESVLHARALK
jgi:hypothetical protein